MKVHQLTETSKANFGKAWNPQRRSYFTILSSHSYPLPKLWSQHRKSNIPLPLVPLHARTSWQYTTNSHVSSIQRSSSIIFVLHRQIRTIDAACISLKDSGHWAHMIHFQPSHPCHYTVILSLTMSLSLLSHYPPSYFALSHITSCSSPNTDNVFRAGGRRFASTGISSASTHDCNRSTSLRWAGQSHILKYLASQFWYSVVCAVLANVAAYLCVTWLMLP